MISFTATIERFDSQGEKTGWTYISVPAEMAQQLKPGNKKGFRAKGKLDGVAFKQVALMPMGGGDFIMALNSTIRRQLRKDKGATVTIKMEVDDQPIEAPAELLECLADDPEAEKVFNAFARSHQTYFINYIQSAKTLETKARRIAQTVNACSRHMDYGQMIREAKQQRQALK